MTTLPAGAEPDGAVRVTTCPTRVWSRRTLNPSLWSSARASAKVRPTTSGMGTTGGALVAGALGVGLALRVGVGVLVGDAARELAGGAGREPVGGARPEAAGDAGTAAE